MTGIKFGAEFRLRYALAIEFVCHRKYAKAQCSSPVTTVNSVIGISRFAHRQVRPKKLSAVVGECRV